MANVQILHLGGLELDETNIEERKSQLENLRPLLDGQVEYVVVCGNLTKAGRFDLVEECLNILEPDERRRQRVLITPGPSDPDEGFRKFHARYYGNAHQAPSREGLDARSLRDVTLIAARFDFQAQGEAKLEMKEVCDLLKERVKAWHGSGRSHKLRVLAISANPFQVSPHLYRQRELDTLQQNIDLILCGRTHLPLIPMQPFSALPAVIGTSGNAVEGQSSFSFNILSLRLPPRPRVELARAQYSIQTYESHLRLAAPDFSYVTAGFESTASQMESVLLCKQTLIPKIEDFLASDGVPLFEVYGYGDVWKSIIKDGLQSLSRIGKYEVTIETFVLSAYPSLPKGTKWEDEDLPLLDEIDAWWKGLRHRQGRIPVALVVDQAYSPNVGADRNRLDEVKKRLAGKFQIKNGQSPVRIVYLSNSYDVPLVDARGAGEPGRWLLDPVKPKTLSEFLTLASCELPIQPDVFKRLTGGYVGFIKLLTAGLRDHYRDLRSGDSDEAWQFEEAVRQVCAESMELRSETDQFFESLTNCKSATKSFKKKLRSKMLENGKDSILTEDVFISFGEAEAGNLLPALSELCRVKVVDRIAAKRHYLLLERIPFLVDLLSPKPEPVVFLSYDERDGKKMNSLKKTLKKDGIKTWDWHEADDADRPLPDQISRMLTVSKYVVVLWTKNSVASPPVVEEARDALKLSRPGRMRLLNWFEGVRPGPDQEKRREMEQRGQELPTEDEEGNLICPELADFRNATSGFAKESVARLIHLQIKPRLGDDEAVGVEP